MWCSAVVLFWCSCCCDALLMRFKGGLCACGLASVRACERACVGVLSCRRIYIYIYKYIYTWGALAAVAVACAHTNDVFVMYN